MLCRTQKLTRRAATEREASGCKVLKSRQLASGEPGTLDVPRGSAPACPCGLGQTRDVCSCSACTAHTRYSCTGWGH